MTFPGMTHPLPMSATRHAPHTATTTAVPVNPVVRAMAYLFVFSIPFEMPNAPIPLEVPTFTGLVFLVVAGLLHPTTAFRRIPAAVRWFAVYLWIFLAVMVIGANDHSGLALRQFAHAAQVVVVLWVLFNLLGDARVLRGVLLAIVAACTLRALMQWIGIAETARAVYTGGARVTVLGQNANLSAIILSVGLVTVIGLHTTRVHWLPRFELLAWPLAAAIGVAVIQTGSRGGLLCVIAGLLVYVFRGDTWGRRVVNAVVGTAALTAFAWTALQSDVMRSRLELSAEKGDLAGRERIYPAAWQMFTERPMLGWGPIDNQAEIARRVEWQADETRDAHNLVLELLTTTGIVGTIPFLIGLALCVRAAWRARNGVLGRLPLAMLATVFMGCVSGTWIVAKVLWLALAISLAAGAYWAAPPPTVRGGTR